MWMPVQTAFVNPDDIKPVPFGACLQNAAIMNSSSDVCVENGDMENYFIDEDVVERYGIDFEGKIYILQSQARDLHRG